VVFKTAGSIGFHTVTDMRGWGLPIERWLSNVGGVTLEDSLGDILRKARTSTHTEPVVAAQAAGLAVSEYERMEETGKPAAGCRFAV
jgi:hypothetical protein